MVRVGLAGSAFAAALFVTQPARAADPLTLTWNAPPGCPTGADVTAAALRAASHATETVEATANVAQTGPSAWHVRLAMRGSERDIDAPTCAGVADATAVVLALALTPALTLEPPAPPPPPAAPPPPSPAPAPARREEHHVAAGIAGAAVLGTLPSAAVGGALDLAWTPGRLRFEAEGSLFGAQSAHVAGKPEGARFHPSALVGRACYAVVRQAVFDVAPCAGAGATVIAADGFGADKNLGRATSFAVVDAGALGRVFLYRWLALRLRGEADVALARPRFLVRDQGAAGLVYRPPTLGAGAFFGAEVLFL